MNGLFSLEDIDWIWRGLVVQVFIFALFLLSFIYISLPLSIDIKPYFLLMAIFFWAIRRPTIISPVLLFGYGLLQDIFFDYPLGLHSALYLIFFYIIRKQRLYLMSQTYLVYLMFFGLLCFIYGVLEWCFFSAVYLKFFEIQALVFSFIFTVLIYPIINWAFTLLNMVLKPNSNIENF